MPAITLTVLIAAIVVAHSPISVDSSRPSLDQRRPDDESTNSSPTRNPPLPPPSKPLSPSTRPFPPSLQSPPTNHTPLSESHHRDIRRKIGFLFLGMAALLQVAVVGFLGFKRWQISTIKESPADSSA